MRGVSEGLTRRGSDTWVVQARHDVARAFLVAGRGRAAEAERRVRRALGVLERRHRLAAAARAAATLGCLLRERGDGVRASSTLDHARVLVNLARTARRGEREPGGGSSRSQGEELVSVEEHEDFEHAQVLLTDPASAQPPTTRTRGGARDQQESLTRLADGAAALYRAVDAASDPLGRICACLRQRVGASAVAVYEWDGGPRLLRRVGSVLPRVVDTLVQGALASDDVLEQEVSLGSVLARPMHDGVSPIGATCVFWARRPSTVVGEVTRHLVALAGSLSAATVAGEGTRHDVAGRGAGLVGDSEAMAVLRESVALAAQSPYPVLVEGETGSGKELVARALHQASPRSRQPFCAVNCAALTDELFEAELFGHVRGAFTGAVAARVGLFEAAHRGTLFLDEVGELSARAQAKLLRVVQEGEVRRVGENVSRRVDVRLVAATNRVLTSEVASGGFRSDLLYRLGVLRISVPPLRERRDDVAALATHFWRRACETTGSRATLSAATVAALETYGWPGNVRQLENVIASLVVRAPKRGWVRPQCLPQELLVEHGSPARGTTLALARESFDRTFVRAALVRAGGKTAVAARELDISRQGLSKLMKRLGLGRVAGPRDEETT